MSDVIDITAIEDNLMRAKDLRAWSAALPDICLAAITPAVDEMLRLRLGKRDVVLLNPSLRTDPDPVLNVQRLVGSGHSVLVIGNGSADLAVAPHVLAAGARGYLTRDHGMQTLTEALRASTPLCASTPLRASASSGTVRPSGPVPAPGPRGSTGLPRLSEQEQLVLSAYASGLTLNSVARRLGISPETARTYLKRVKAKYKRAGMPAYTKLDLADRVRASQAEGAIARLET
jgi:DNA-binding NarL/FixJ family response regulator